MRVFLLVLLLQFFNGATQASSLLGYDYADNFLIFDEDKGVYLVNPEKKLRGNIVNFLARSSEKNNTLNIYNPEKLSIFINSKFYQNVKGKDTAKIEISKILGNKDQALVAIYSPVILNKLKVSAQKNNYILSNESKSMQPVFWQVKSEKNKMINRYIFGIAIILISLAVLKLNIPEIGKYISNIISLGNFNSRAVFQRKDGAIIIIFIIILFSSMIFIFTPSLKGEMEFLNAQNTYRLSIILIYMIILSFINIFFHNLLGGLFKTSKLSRLYTIELLFIVMILIMLFIPFYMIIFTPFLVPYILGTDVFDYVVWIFSIFLMINELYFFYGKHRIRKIYIISYICICNIIPFIVSYKIVKDFHIA